MNGQKTISNDRLGLTGVWHLVPEEGPRPESAILFDRKVDPAKKIPEYNGQLAEYIRKAKLRREEKQRASDNEHAAQADSQVN